VVTSTWHLPKIHLSSVMRGDVRQRSPRIKLDGYENDHCVVLRTEKPSIWIVRCKYCGKEHEQNSREIQKNAKNRECELFKPHNWTGFEREDAIMRRQYGISMEEFDELLEFQGGGCAICSKPIDELRRRMNIDHDHKNGKVRGILCSGCNTGLGHLGDNIEGLKKALYYLENTPFDEFANAR